MEALDKTDPPLLDEGVSKPESNSEDLLRMDFSMPSGSLLSAVRHGDSVENDRKLSRLEDEVTTEGR